MNKLMRNPWVVTALVVGMAALWWVQMRDILMPGGVAESSAPATLAPVAAVATPPPNSGASEPLVVVPTASVPTQLRWDNNPARDPFGPATTKISPPSVATSETPGSAAEPVLVALEPVLALAAVLNTPSAQIAVIDGRIVRVGDQVGGRAVLQIDNTSVALGSSLAWPQPLVLKLPRR